MHEDRARLSDHGDHPLFFEFQKQQAPSSVKNQATCSSGMQGPVPHLKLEL